MLNQRAPKNRELIMRAQSGDVRSANKLIKEYEGLIKWALPKYLRSDPDEVQEASIDFWKAVVDWDPESGFELTSFASKYILKGYLMRRYYNNAQKRSGYWNHSSLDAVVGEDKKARVIDNFDSTKIEYAPWMNSSIEISSSFRRVVDLIDLKDRVDEVYGLLKESELGKRELEVFSLHLNGETNSQISKALEISRSNINSVICTARSKVRKTYESIFNKFDETHKPYTH